MKVRLPKGMGGGPSDMNSLMRQAQKMQENMQNLQSELDAREYEISAGGGVMKIVISGKKEIKSIKLDEAIVDPEDIETLEDILVAGVNEAIKTVEEKNSAEMSQVTGGMGIPGMM